MLSSYFEADQTVFPTQNFYNNILSVDHNEDIFNKKGMVIISSYDAISTSICRQMTTYYNHFKNLQIDYAGILKNQDPKAIDLIINELNSKSIIPVFVGISAEIAGQISASLQSGMVQIANKINNLTHPTAYIRSNFLGYQRHLCGLDDIHEIEQHLYDSMSLGKIRTYPHLTEPVLRDVSIIHLDLSSIRLADCPGCADGLPTGLNAEELCQLMKYSGMSSQLKSFFINTDNLTDDSKQIHHLIAESIWYFAEGLNHRTKDHPFLSSDSSEFIVYSESLEEDLIFLKNNQTQKWWIKKPDSNPPRYMAVSYEEYQSSIGEEIAERIMKFINENRDSA